MAGTGDDESEATPELGAALASLASPPDADEADTPQEKWRKRAWEVYEKHLGIFAMVLRQTGPWQTSDGLDVLHDFLLDRLPCALASYDSSRPIEPWLTKVFSRFARRYLREQRKANAMWNGLESCLDQPREHADPSESDELQGLHDAIQSLQPRYAGALEAYFNGRGTGSIRSITRMQSVSRTRAKADLLAAVGQLAALMPEQSLLSDREVALFKQVFVNGKTWDQLDEPSTVAKTAVAGVLKRLESAVLSASGKKECKT